MVLSLVALLLALTGWGLAQGTMRRQTPESETTDSSGHVRTDNGEQQSDSSLHGLVVLANGPALDSLAEIYSDCDGLRSIIALTDPKARFLIDGHLASALAQNQACFLWASVDGYRSSTKPLAEWFNSSGKNKGEIRLEPFSSSSAGLASANGQPTEKGQVKMYKRAREDAAKQDWPKAIASLRSVVSGCSNCAAAWFALGIVQQIAGGRKDAEESFLAAARADAAFAPPLIHAAALAAVRGDWQATSRLAQQAIELNTTAFPNAYALAAIANINLQKIDAAQKSATEGLKLDTGQQFPELEYALGMALYSNNQLEDARKHLEAYLARSKKGPDASAAQATLAEIKGKSAGKGSASAAPAQQASRRDSPVSLDLVLAHNAPLLEKTPDHTCLESIAQLDFDDRGKAHGSGLTRGEVAISNGDEIYLRAGDKRFANERLAEVGENTFSTTGLFSSIARAVVAGNDMQIEPAGLELLNGEPVARYDFHLLPGVSGWSIRYGKETGRAAEEGSFFVAVSNAVLRRVSVRAVNLPRNLGLKSLEAVIDYEPETIGGRLALLPAAADVRVEERGGERRMSHLLFDHCREFGAESTLMAAPEEAGSSRDHSMAAPELPPGVDVAVSILSPLSPATAGAGDLLRATVAEPVTVGGHEILERGAVIEGHVRPRRGANAVVIELDRVETRKGWAPFYAHLVSLAENVQARITGTQASANAVSAGRKFYADNLAMPDPEVPGVAVLEFTSGSSELPAGTRMIWKTERLATATESRAPQLETAVVTR